VSPLEWVELGLLVWGLLAVFVVVPIALICGSGDRAAGYDQAGRGRHRPGRVTEDLDDELRRLVGPSSRD
jgi:hypothetical protein